MLKPWLREVCRMPGDGGEGGGGSGGGIGNSGDFSFAADEAGHGKSADPTSQGASNGPGTGTGNAGDIAAGIDGAMGNTAHGMGMSAEAAAAAGINGAMGNGPASMSDWAGIGAMSTGENLSANRGVLDRAWDAITGNIGATLAGVVGTAFAGPFAGAIASAIASNAIDGKSPGEAIGQGIGGLAGMGVGGLTGMGMSMAGSRGGAAIGSQLDSAFGSPGQSTSTAGLSLDPTSTAFDIGGPPDSGPPGGGVDFTYSPPVAGETFNSYMPTPGQSSVQPAWRGLLAPPPQPNYWQGNSLFMPTRGLLS